MCQRCTYYSCHAAAPFFGRAPLLAAESANKMCFPPNGVSAAVGRWSYCMCRLVGATKKKK
jgi:hypothetical protein